MKDKRREQVLQYIETRGEAMLDELEELFPGCSIMTLRRDLLALEQEGRIKRIRGGAVALKQLVGFEGMYSHRAIENTRGKMEIARIAAQCLDPSSSLYLDSGSTVMSLARVLPDSYRPIITSGVNIALELVKRPSFSVTLLGGQLNSNTLSVSGPIAEASIDTLNIETAIMSTSGFSLDDGFTSGTFTENELKRIVVAKARHVIMLMDTGKIGRSMPLTFATLQNIDALISDAYDTGLADACQKHGVQFRFPVR